MIVFILIIVEKPVLVRDDKSIKEFRRWYSQFYSPNSRFDQGELDNVGYEGFEVMADDSKRSTSVCASTVDF